MQRGRVRVLLKREDGSLCNPEISSRKNFSIVPFVALTLFAHSSHCLFTY